jgi:uncharacterized protein (DUF1499 family)
MATTTLHASTPVASPGARVGHVLARLALIAGILCALAELLAGPAYRAGALSLSPAIQTMRWGATIALGAAAVALVALLLSAFTQSAARARPRAALALVLGLAVAAPPLYMFWRLQTLPRIHDITTSTDNPPTYEAVLPLRQGARNPVDYAAATAAEQRKAYPDIVPLTLPLAPPAAFARALEAARAMGWEIVAATPDKLRIEATDTTLLFGFKDDVVVRIAPQGSGSVVDVRSLSRVGGSDFGTNANRVRAYLKRLADSASAAS